MRRYGTAGRNDREETGVSEMKTKPNMVRITNSGVKESHVHDVHITKEAPNYRTRT